MTGTRGDRDGSLSPGYSLGQETKNRPLSPKKKRKEKASKNRKDWVGLRPTVYKDKTKYDRQKSKREVEKCY